ncbi:bactericidal permeability-increasing protein [Manacus vitellinus]|uniref:bactericidal permeability-increasing protein n=1 Tax=Manacus vitellinus TaxID=328815 RepID=UPI00115C740A|nr:bactericidal permeability-increasing protein [Manacus vitellinus]
MGVQSLAVACGALAFCLALTTATNPGFVVRITQAGLDYAHQHGIAMLEKKLAELTLPDMSGDFRVLRVGKVHYELSRLRLRSFHLPYSRISPVPNVGLQVAISNAFAELDGDWRVKMLFIRDHGSFDLKVENVYIKISLRLGSDTTGKPTISTSDCSTRISKVRVLFSGKFGWLYNLFHSAVESKFKKILESKVCDSVAESVHKELQTYARTLPVTAKIDARTGIDYSFVAPPVATAQSLDTGLKGEFYSLAHRSTVPFSPLPLSLPSDHDRMVYFGASSYFFNTAGFAYHTSGALVFEITDAMGQRVAPLLSLCRIKLSLKDSVVGTFQVRLLQSIMNIFASDILLPRLNARLDEGFPLPLPDRIRLLNTFVRFHQNFLLLGADVHFQPKA